ncbi:hypothetical protein P7K49_005936 [Saguinus oedipus]|uniref:Uncharacterized protein n=1 Tax=Saguinus oedipus TaxID=9490 RepID=A0ABQ9W0Y8_SAGOE|nr:hypothetical protein P7K49_005936 [Saguinus oedipus]
MERLLPLPRTSSHSVKAGGHLTIQHSMGILCPLDKAVAEPVSRLLESTLRSSHLPSRVGALHGILYVLECDLLDDTAKQLIPVISDYLLSSLKGLAQ